MNARVAAWLAAAGLAGAAAGQVITTPGITASLDLTWQEDPDFLHNDNGLLEPGEHALILTTLSFTGQFTSVSFSPPIGPYSVGTFLGLGTAYFDLRSATGDATGLYNGGLTNPPSTSTGPNADASGLSGYGVRGGWRLGANSANGLPTSNGFMSIGAGQLPALPTMCNTQNPIANIDRLGWAPSIYSTRTQTFQISRPPPSEAQLVGLYIDLDGGVTGGVAYLPQVRITLGSVNIPIVRSPAGLALLGLAASVSGCRPVRKSLLLEESR